MIVNAEEFFTFLHNENNGLGNFNEVILPYCKRSDHEIPALHFQRVEERKSYNLICFNPYTQLKFLSLLKRENVSPLKNCNVKYQIFQLIIYCCVLIKAFQGG